MFLLKLKVKEIFPDVGVKHLRIIKHKYYPLKTFVKYVKIKTQQPIFLTVEIEGLRKVHTTGGPAFTLNNGSYLMIVSGKR